MRRTYYAFHFELLRRTSGSGWPVLTTFGGPNQIFVAQINCQKYHLNRRLRTVFSKVQYNHTVDHDLNLVADLGQYNVK